MKINKLIGAAFIMAAFWSSLQARTHHYDSGGRLIMVAHADGSATQYIYDAADNLTAVQPLTVPAAPTGLTVSRTSSTAAMLSWTDESSGESGFAIWRRPAGNHAWDQIGVAPANATSFSDMELTADEEFVYRVAALLSTALDDTLSSAYSNEATTAIRALLEWRVRFFGSVSNTGNAANFADFEFDGILNMIEFAFGLDPTISENDDVVIENDILIKRGLPFLTTDTEGEIEQRYAVFLRRKDYVSEGLTYTPEFSADLELWEPGLAAPEIIAQDDEFEVLQVPFPAAVDGLEPRFFQVEVTLSP